MVRSWMRPFVKSSPRPAQPRQGKLRLESLEPRCTPAGTLTAVPFTSLFPQPVEGSPFTGQIATAFDTGPVAPTFTVTINWGDGTPLDTTTGTVTPIAGSPGAFTVNGTHT